MKTKALFILLLFGSVLARGATGTLIEAFPQVTTAETNALILIERNPFTPQRQTAGIPIWRLPIAGGGGNATNALEAITGDVVATGPGTAASTIQPGAVTSGKIGAGAVGTQHLLDTNVTTSKLQDLAVTNPKIAARSVTDGKLELGSAAVATSSGTITFDFDGTFSQVTTATGAQTIAINNKPSSSAVDRSFNIVFAPASTLTLTWPTTVGGSATNWLGSILTTVAANTVRVVFVEWNGQLGKVVFQDQTEPIDADLLAIAALSTTGYAKRTGTDAWSLVTPIPFGDVAGVVAFAGQIGGSADLPDIRGIRETGGQLLTFTNITDGEFLKRTGNVIGSAPASAGGSSNSPPIFVQRSLVVISNTVQETSILGTLTGSASLGANFFSQGRNTEFTLRGGLGTDATTPGTGQIKVKLGATVVAKSGSVTLPAGWFAETNIWRLTGDIACWTTGASGTVRASGEMVVKDGAKDMTIPFWNPVTESGTVTIDTTANLALAVTWQFDTADTDNVITCYQAKLVDGGNTSGGGGGSGGTAVFVNSSSIDSPNFKDSNLIRWTTSGSDITALPASIVSLSYSGTNVTMNADLAKSFKLTLTQNTGLNISGGQEGDTVFLRTREDATGAWVLNGATNFLTNDQFTSRTPITISTNANVSSLIRFYCFGSGAWGLLGPLTGFTAP